MGKTLTVAADREHDQTKTIVPAEHARAMTMRNAPSLSALKLFHAMIATAAGRMADDARHDIRLSALRAIDGMHNHDRASLAPLFEELRDVGVTLGNPDDDTERLEIGGLLDGAIIERRDPQTGDTIVSWYFSHMFRSMAARSDHWAILDRQAVFHFNSKYSVLLYQHIASFQSYHAIDSINFPIAKLRALLGVPAGKVKRFADLNDRAIKPAIAEINHLSRLQLTAELHKTGRTVTSVTIHWQPKEDLADTKRELAAPKVGRAARRTSTAETAAQPAFPASGSIAYEPHWLDLKRRAGCNMDNAMIANNFRAWCADRGLPLDSRKIADTFTAYCAKVGKV